MLRYILFVLIVLVDSNIYSQKNSSGQDFLTFNIKVEKNEDEGLGGATVKLFEKGTLVSTQNTSVDGIVSVQMSPNSEYVIEISKQDYVTKMFSINTKIPNYEKRTFEYSSAVGLFKPCEGLDVTALQNPVLKLIYDEFKRDFIPDPGYEEIMMGKLQQLMKNNENCENEKFNSVVRKADRLFTEKKYPDSKDTYKQALELRPDDKYVKGRIAEIDRLMANQKNNDKLYNDYISQADNQFNSKSYPLAKEFYKRAQMLKPDEPYPAAQIKLIEDLLSKKNKDEQDKQATEARFQQLLSQAASAATSGNYQAAKQAYRDALVIKPDDAGVIQKIADIDARMKKEEEGKNQKKALDDKYNAALIKADELFKNGKYDEAKAAYQSASSVKPEETYPFNQIDKINEALKKQTKDAESAYRLALKVADEAFDNKTYTKAKDLYQKVLALKANDVYAQSQIKLCDKNIDEQNKKAAQEKATSEAYSSAIVKADDLFKNGKYDEAKAAYQSASSVKPDELYPLDQIDKINETLKKQAKDAESAYRLALKVADEAFDSKTYTKAKDLYQKVLALKASDTYAQSQIKLCEKYIDEQNKKTAKEKATKEAYSVAIVKADDLYKSGKYAEAKAAYEATLAITPDAAYPQQQIEGIDALLKKIAQDAEDAYKNALAAADEAFDNKTYPQAKDLYNKVLGLRPHDTYSQNQIKLIDKIIDDQNKRAAADKALRDKYNAAVAEADNYFKTNNYTSARSSYEKASQIIPTEDYPRQKIREIDNLARAKEKEKEQQYKAFIASGDKAFDNETFDLAKENYLKASGIKPEETYPKDKIKTIDNILAEQKRLADEKKAKQEQYDKMLASADAAFKNKDYSAAKTAYLNALQIIPSESYPKQQLAEIESIQNEMSEKKEKDYAAKIQLGDRSFMTKSYDQSKQAYQDALTIKPGEEYPKQRINEINRILEQIAKAESEKKAKDDAYNNAIARADNLYKTKDYDQAISAYKAASTIKPEEQYPYSQIELINKNKKEIENEQNYKQSITLADASFQKKQYDQAKTSYTKALGFKPNDTYATTQLKKTQDAIDSELKRLADQQARQKAYDDAIAEADKNFGIKDYENAQTSYERALAVFPDKPYPKDKIAEITRILKAKKLDENYSAALTQANDLFADKSYDQAKVKYKEALGLKPAEIVPAEKIKEIDKILAQLEADKQKRALNEKNYNDAIAKANELFDKGQYDPAKKEYERALTFMPEEVFPKQRIAKINELKSLLAKQSATPTEQKKKEPAAEAGLIDLKFNSDSERQQYLKTLLAKYPPGITCEVYREKRRTVVRFIIIRDNVANDFREVKYNWGGVEYFRNDKPVTDLYFKSQVKAREGEYFTESEM